MMRLSSLLSAIAILLWGLTIVTPNKSVADVIPDDAAQAFKMGQSLFSNGKYLKAAEAFEWAYRLAPHPDVLANIGYCYDEAGDYPRAAEFYRKYLDNPNPDDRATQTKIKKYLRKLLAKVADLRVDCVPLSCKVTVDDVYRGSGPIALALEPGSHTVEVEFTDGRPARQWNLVIPRGKQRVIDVDLSESQPSSPTSSPSTDPLQPRLVPRDPEPNQALLRPPFWIATAVTIAGGVAAGVLGALAYRTWQDFGDSGKTALHLKDRGEKLRLATNIAIGFTAAAATTAIIFAIVDVKRDRKKAGKDRKTAKKRSELTATVSPFGSVGLCLSF